MGLRHRCRSRLGPHGLNEDIVRFISQKKNEPDWMLAWRLKAYRHWLTMEEPPLGDGVLSADRLPEHDLLLGPQAEARRVWTKSIRSSGDLRKTGHPACRNERLLAGVAVDAVFDSVSVTTTFRTSWRSWGSSSARSAKRCSIIRNWCRNMWGRWSRTPTISFATLNCAVFTDGSFVYIPKGVRCPMELSTYFRINARTPGSSSAR